MPTGLDSYGAKVDNVSKYLAADVNNLQDAVTQVERISVGPTMYNLTGQGADPTGAVDASSILNSLLGTVKSSGAEIWCPGRYLFNSAINADGCAGVILKGVNGVQGSAPTSRLIYSGGSGAANFIKATSTFGFQIRNLYVTNNNSAFNGYLLDLQHGVANTDSADAVVADSLFSVSGTVGKHINLDKLLYGHFERSYFSGGAQATSATNYANAIHFDKCRFQNFTGIPIQATTGQGWEFVGCAWEPLLNNQAGAISVSGINGLNVIGGCWMGDVGGTASSWITFSGNGLNVLGNFISGNATSTAITVSGSSNFGIVVKGNAFANHTVGVSIGSAVNDFIEIAGNSWTSVTTPVSGTPKSGIVNVTTPHVVTYGHIVAGGAAPAVSAINAGISGTPTVTGHDNAFYIDLSTTGTPPGAAAKLFTVTYNGAFPAIPAITLTTGGAADVRFGAAAPAAGSIDIYTLTALTGTTNYRIYANVTGI